MGQIWVSCSSSASSSSDTRREEERQKDANQHADADERQDDTKALRDDAGQHH